MRVVQNPGAKGSLKWIQHAINDARKPFDRIVLNQLPEAEAIEWRSPLASDKYAEYRDSTFLDRIGHPELSEALANFWPSRGPQWDALGRTKQGEILLVEAKAHIDEMFSSGTQAGQQSRVRIERTLSETAEALHAKPLMPWSGSLYQTTNRLAHLRFLTDQKVPARLMFVYFLGDDDMQGPATADEWRGALRVARHMLGLPKRHRLSDRIIDVFVPVRDLGVVQVS
jgi:hypothetical protein